MKHYNSINNLTGWLTFAIAAFVYLSTIEPTASFWDCGEFIASAYKLQVGHPPGASLFLLIARVFTMFSFDDVKMVPVMVNILSALSSAVTILFLFWSITHLARKLIKVNDEQLTLGHTLMVMGSGLVGAVAYTFSDSFWFSAVEGEVYAMSSMFTAIVFWAMLKWEHHADERHSDRWLILIAYLMGLSIGVHLLNLLTIPALAYIYYFRRYKVTTQGLIKTGIAGVAILGFVQYGIIQGFVRVGAQIDLLFVNTLGMPFWSGFLFFVALLIAGIIFGLRYTQQRNKPLFNTAVLCFAFIVLGYASYAQVVIRSMANPPMDENNPENAFALLSYLNREQYGDRPLGFGQYYNAKVIDQKEGATQYAELDGKYVKTGNKIEPVYDPKATTLFPRMYSSQENHVEAYKEWANIKGERTPKMSENIGFFFSYQLGHMFWRYFMWNFAGRQNDNQGHGGILKGNWISGIQFIDEKRLGPQDRLPEGMQNNAGRNTFYLLPLILGIVGMIFHFRKNVHDGTVVTLLFFFTGIAIVIYLNQTPYQPRERDYAYAGSFYAFAIWIGLGVMALADFLSKKTSATIAAVAATTISFVAVPVVMAKEGWDDHNRSHRYTSRDFAYNYLNSCAPNAIIFTNGDNDTFPLWYIQEVEGVRTDVRVVNLSLLNTDWYIMQMKRKAYDSDPVPFSLTYDKIIQGTRDYIPYYDRGLQGFRDLKSVVDFFSSDDPGAKATTQGGMTMNYFPTKNFSLNVDRETVLANGTVTADLADRIVPKMEWSISSGKNYLMKSEIMILDLLANNNWQRPVYFAVTVGSESYLNLEDYFQLEGLAYRLVPIKSARARDGQTGRVNTEAMYHNMVEVFQWGNMSDQRVYLDQNNLNMTMNLRNNFSRLAESLLGEGKRDSAFTALNKCLEVMPDKTVPYNIMMLRIAELYHAVGKYHASVVDTSGLAIDTGQELKDNTSKQALETGNGIIRRLAEIYEKEFDYYNSLKGTKYSKLVERELGQSVAVIQELGRLARGSAQADLVKEMDDLFKSVEKKYYDK